MISWRRGHVPANHWMCQPWPEHDVSQKQDITNNICCQSVPETHLNSCSLEPFAKSLLWGSIYIRFENRKRLITYYRRTDVCMLQAILATIQMRCLIMWYSKNTWHAESERSAGALFHSVGIRLKPELDHNRGWCRQTRSPAHRQWH